MKTKKELQGYWKPPGGENWVGGTAVYHPEEGITLQLFEPLGDRSMTEPTSFDYILGNTTDEGEVTLRNCNRTRISEGSNSLSTEKYSAKYLFIGNHIPETEPSFTRFRVSYPLLHQWAGLTGLQRKLPAEDNEYDPSEIDMHYSPPTTETAKGETRSVKVLTSANISHSVAGSFSVDEKTYLEIVPTTGGIGFEELMDEVNDWRDFVTFAMDDNVGINEIRAYQEDESGEEDNVQVYFEASGEFEYPDSFHPHRTNFQLDDLGDDAATVLTNWMQLTERYKSVYDLYFAVVYQEQMYLENQYMMLVTALNLYYQKRYENKYLDGNEFVAVMNSVRDSLPNDIDEGFRSHLLQDVLRSANQHSLERRLSTIAEDHQNILAELPWDTAEEISELVGVHDYTVGRSSELQEVGPEWLYKKTAFMSTLLEVTILSDMGVPEEHIREQLSRKYRRRLDIP